MSTVTITEEQMNKIASLARVPLPADADDRAKVIEKFQKVLTFVAQIESIDVPDSIEHQAFLGNITRFDDVVTGSEVRDNIIESFPDRQGDYLVVPKVLGKKGEAN